MYVYFILVLIEPAFASSHSVQITPTSPVLPPPLPHRGGSRIFRTLVKNVVAEHRGRGTFDWGSGYFRRGGGGDSQAN